MATWGANLKSEKPLGRSSRYVAAAFVKEIVEEADCPVALLGLQRVWFMGSNVGGDFAELNIVQTDIN